MNYCQFCGAKLEDGRQCTCQGAQQAAVRQNAVRQAAAQRTAPLQPAVPKTVLIQEKKEEMQKIMAQAGKSAKAAGKAVGNSAKSLVGSAQGALSEGAAVKGSALYRKVMLAFGALHVLLFFILPYAKMGHVSAEVKLVMQMTGIDLPRSLTGMNLIRLMQISADLGGLSSKAAASAMMWNVILFSLPVLFSVLLILLNLRKKEGGMISAIILSVLTLLSYVLVNAFLMSDEMARSFKELNYKTGFGFGLAAIVVILQIVVAVMGHIAGRKAGKAGKIDPRAVQAVNTSGVPAAEVPVPAAYSSAPSAFASHVPAAPASQASQAAVPAPAPYVPAAPVSQTPQTAPVPAAPAPAEYTPASPVPAVSVPQASPAHNLFCRNCGARFLGNGKFCGSCGAPVAPDPNEYGQ